MCLESVAKWELLELKSQPTAVASLSRQHTNICYCYSDWCTCAHEYVHEHMDLQADLIDRTAMEIRNKKTEVCVWACGCAVDGFVGVPAHLCPKLCSVSVCVRARARTLHSP